jgi:hypothetical protein
MKYLSLIVCFISFSAMACPNFVGEYSVCRTKKNIMIESTNLIVTQTVVNGVKHIKFDTLPDGQNEREVTVFEISGKPVRKVWRSDGGTTFESVTTASCFLNTMKVKTTIHSNGEALVSESSTYRKVGRTIVQETKGSILTIPFDDVLTCY